jgi:hypothetical protein
VHDLDVPDTREAPLEFRRFTEQDSSRVVDFLSQEEWPFHGVVREQPEEILQRIVDGYYDAPEVLTFWVVLREENVGMIRLFDLRDDTPMFDLRIDSAHPGKGLGSGANFDRARPTASTDQRSDSKPSPFGTERQVFPRMDRPLV